MDCSLTFENKFQKFYSGQEVRGSIVIQNDKLRESAGIFLIIEGTAETHWTETEGTGDDSKSVSYGGTQKLIFTTISLLQNEKGLLT